jgi:pimeloyl-ACP methyl ester carboxylesterase
MGYYDLPAMTSFIVKETGQPKLSYIGHSMGTTMFFVFCTMRPELQSRIREMHALAPVVFTSHCKSPIALAASVEGFLQIALLSVGQNEMFRHGSEMGYLEQQVLKFSNVIGSMGAEMALSTIAGSDPDQFDEVRNVFKIIS